MKHGAAKPGGQKRRRLWLDKAEQARIKREKSAGFMRAYVGLLTSTRETEEIDGTGGNDRRPADRQRDLG
jgi:hypothetical protein